MKAYFLERICAVTGMNLKIEDIPILFDSTLVTESTIRCVSNSMLDVSNQIIKYDNPQYGLSKSQSFVVYSMLKISDVTDRGRQ